MNEIFQNRVDFLPPFGIPNYIYYVPNGNGDDLDHYLADNNGLLRFVGTRPFSGYTDEQAQDAVGNNFLDTNTIDAIYTDATPSFLWNVRYQDSLTVNLSDDASGLKADVIVGGTDNTLTNLIVWDGDEFKLRTVASIISAVTIPTWQQTLTAGSTLTGNNTVVNGANTFEITNNSLAGTSGVKFSSTSTAAASNLQRLVEINLSGANATANQTTTALYVINTHTGSNSQNRAAYFESSGNNGNTVVINSNGSGAGSGLNVTKSGTGLGYAGYFSSSNTGGFTYGIHAEATAGNFAIGGEFSATGGVISNTALQTISGNVLLNQGNGFTQFGTNGGNTGIFKIHGVTSGIITIQPQIIAGTYNFNLPITAGTTGYLLTSQGGAGTAMTWTDPSTFGSGITIGATTITSGTDKRVLFNDGGFVGEDSGFTYDKTSDLLSIPATGKYRIATTQMVYLPNQSSSLFEGTMVFGNGGNSLSHGSGLEGQYNLLVGYNTGLNLTTGNLNVFIGNQVAYFATSATRNTVMGHNAGLHFSSDDYNTYIGYTNGNAANASFFNTSIGASGMLNLIGASYNSGGGVNNFHELISGIENSGFGLDVFYNITTGIGNTGLGTKAGRNFTTSDSYNISIGYKTQAVPAGSSQTLNIGNFIFGTGIDGIDTSISAAKIGLGILPANITAILHLAAGATTMAPLRLTSGTLTTGGNILAGNIEFLTDRLYLTKTTGPTRETIAYLSDITGSGVTSITGTVNQVIASAATGAITLSLPQSIATTSTVQFGAIGIGTATSGVAFDLTTAGNTYMRIQRPNDANDLQFIMKPAALSASTPQTSFGYNGGSALWGVTLWDGGAGVYTPLQIGVTGKVYIKDSTDNGAYDFQVNGTGYFAGDIIVPDEAYDATTWNGSLETPTKNAVRDKFESLIIGITRTVINTSGSITMGSTASTDYVYFVTGAHTMTLPSAVSNTNKYTVKNTTVAARTVDTTGGELVEGGANVSIPAGMSYSFISNNINWFII